MDYHTLTLKSQIFLDFLSHYTEYQQNPATSSLRGGVEEARSLQIVFTNLFNANFTVTPLPIPGINNSTGTNKFSTIPSAPPIPGVIGTFTAPTLPGPFGLFVPAAVPGAFTGPFVPAFAPKNPSALTFGPFVIPGAPAIPTLPTP